MASKVSALQEFQVVVRQADQVENWFSLAPMKPCRVYISVDETMVVHMSDSWADLSKYEKKSGRWKIYFAKLFPKTNVLWAVSLEKDCIALMYFGKSRLQVEDIWMRRESWKLLRHLVCKELLVVVKWRDVNECQEAEVASFGIRFKADLTVTLLRVDDVDLNVWLRLKAFSIRQKWRLIVVCWLKLFTILDLSLIKKAWVLLKMQSIRFREVVGKTVVAGRACTSIENLRFSQNWWSVWYLIAKRQWRYFRPKSFRSCRVFIRLVRRFLWLFFWKLLLHYGTSVSVRLVLDQLSL